MSPWVPGAHELAKGVIPDPLSTYGAWHSGGKELASQRHSPLSLGSRMGQEGKGGHPLLNLAALKSQFYLVPHSGEGELPGQELAPLLPEM